MEQKPNNIEDLKKITARWIVQWLPIDTVKENPDNPRVIADEDYEALKKSIQEFPEMMLLRPGVVNKDNVLQGNNQRHKACKELGWAEFPVIYAESLTAEQFREFTIKDNFHAGKWDSDKLFKDWDMNELEAWDFDTSIMEVRPQELSLIASTQPEGRVKHMKALTLKYTEKDWQLVKDKLAAIAETPEEAVWILTGLGKAKAKKTGNRKQ